MCDMTLGNSLIYSDGWACSDGSSWGLEEAQLGAREISENRLLYARLLGHELPPSHEPKSIIKTGLVLGGAGQENQPRLLNMDAKSIIEQGGSVVPYFSSDTLSAAL